MKKNLLLLVCLLGLSLPASAVISPEELASPTYTMQHGYSAEMARLIDLQNTQITGAPKTYVNPDPAWYETNKFVKFVRNVFIYLDPALDNEKFGDNRIEFSNTYKEEL